MLLMFTLPRVLPDNMTVESGSGDEKVKYLDSNSSVNLNLLNFNLRRINAVNVNTIPTQHAKAKANAKHM